jgi:Carboxypeptidase regulatory-like domain
VSKEVIHARIGAALVVLSALALYVLGGSVSADAQSTFGSIVGVVHDTTQAVVPGASIKIRRLEDNSIRSTTSDENGSFEFVNLKPGTYALSAQAEGFAEFQVPSAELTSRQELRIDVTLGVKSQSQTVEVSDTVAVINTENGVISDSKNNSQITQLPLNNRATTTSPLAALSLSPNVQQDSSGNIALGGASSAMVNFSVDGISTANVRQNGALQDAYPSQEGISAVRVTSFNNSAEFSQVGDVTFTTKSGTSQFHGTLFEYLQNDALDADPYGFSGKAPKHFNTLGGSLGGPLSVPHLYNGKDKTFFFLDYEGNRRSTAVADQFLVPTQDERNGDLAALCSTCSAIPTGSINPTAKALLSYYPLPNVTGQSNYNYENFQATPARTDGADLRIDHTINSKQSVYARFSRKNITEDYASPFLPDDSDSVHNRSLLVSHTWVLTPRLLNEFRFGFTNVSTSVGFPIEGADALSQLDLTGVNISQHPTTHAFPTFNFSAGTGFTPIGRDKTGVTQSKTIQFTDNLSWTRGKHTLKAGLDARRVRYFDLESFAPVFNSDDFGDFVFQGTFTGNAFGDFIEGTPTSLFFAVSSPDVGGTAWQYGVYGQDEYQINSRLTLSYGLRWQILPGFHEDGGNLANFDGRNNSIVVPNGLPAYLQQQNIQASNLAFQQSFNACNLGYTALPCTNYVTASQDHLPQSLRNIYTRNFQPRVSIAWRPFNDTKTVIRAGFGIFTMTNLGPLSFNNSGNPTSALHTYTNTATAGGAPLIQFPNTAPPSVGIQYGGGGLDQGVDPNYRDPQANQWNFTVEHQVGNNDSLRVTYVGMHSYRLSITEDLNQILASTTPYQTTAASPYVDPRAPYHNWFTLYSTFNAGQANYNALEIEESHKMSHGLYFGANYTLAKNLADNQGDNPAAFAGEVNYGVPIANRFDVGSDYGNVEGTRRSRFLLTGLYQLPVGEGRNFINSGGWKNTVLGGWELTTVTLLETGPWLTPSISDSYDQSNTDVVNRGAYLRPDQVSGNLYSGQSHAQYFNLAAFSPTPAGAGRFGNAGVGILQGPGTTAVSLGLAKVFPVTERVRMRFESTFTNVLNHTNFAPPATQIDVPATFGVLSAPQTAENAGNRTGQLALRVEF